MALQKLGLRTQIDAFRDVAVQAWKHEETI
jgi:hypothetical protein